MNSLTKNPIVVAIFALILGVALGLTWAWGIDPLKLTDAPISLLRQDLQVDYLRATIDSFRVNADSAQATRRYQEIGATAPQILQLVKKNPGTVDPAVISIFEGVVADAVLPAAEENTDTSGSDMSTVIILFAVLAIGGVGAAAFFVMRRPRAGSGEISAAKSATEFSRSIERTDFEASGSAPPIAQFVTTYVIGDDLFDDSFSIDSPAGKFLGECGVGISDTIGIGDPKKVTAFEVWVFDQNQIETVTKVLMSEHAYSDDGYRRKLESKGELIDIQPGQQVVLETNNLQVMITVVDMQYGGGSLPESSYFERLSLELAIWTK